MKNLKALNLGTGLKREEMRAVLAGLAQLQVNDPYCTCGTKDPALTHCACNSFCDGTCS